MLSLNMEGRLYRNNLRRGVNNAAFFVASNLPVRLGGLHGESAGPFGHGVSRGRCCPTARLLPSSFFPSPKIFDSHW